MRAAIQRFLLIGIGGSIGAVLRYLVADHAARTWGHGFPYGTVFVNLTGSFLLGLFASLALRFGWSDRWRLFVAVGILGSYTTFSAFEHETMQLIAAGGRYPAAAANLLGSMLAGLLAAFLGLVAARRLLRRQP